MIGIDGWICAWRPPKNRSRNGPTSTSSPAATVSTGNPDAAAATPAGPKIRTSGFASTMRPSCSGVQWSSCSWVMTTATVPADSVMGVVNLPGST